MNNITQEILIRKGQLSERRQELHRLETLADNYFTSIRMQLDPMTPFLDVDIDKAIELAREFRKTQIQARKVYEEIKSLERLLGAE